MNSARRHVILVHGMWSRATVWNEWKATLETAGFECTALSLPGHEADADDSALRGKGIADYEAALSRTVSQFRNPIVVAHSLGGLVAQRVAARHRLSALVLISTAAPGQIFPLRPIMLPGILRHFLSWNLWRKPVRLSRFEADYLFFHRMPVERRRRMYATLAAESGRILYEVGFGPLNRSGRTTVDVAAIDCPVLLLCGMRDRIVPIAVSRRIAKLYGRKMQFVEHRSHGHWMLGEDGGATRARDVARWIHGLPETTLSAPET